MKTNRYMEFSVTKVLKIIIVIAFYSQIWKRQLTLFDVYVGDNRAKYYYFVVLSYIFSFGGRDLLVLSNFSPIQAVAKFTLSARILYL